MKSKTNFVITYACPLKLLRFIDFLVKMGVYRNRGDFVRCAIDNQLKSIIPLLQKERIVEKLLQLEFQKEELEEKLKKRRIRDE